MTLDLPLGIDAPPPVPEDNPMTPAKVELGRQLFFDARLSPSHSDSVRFLASMNRSRSSRSMSSRRKARFWRSPSRGRRGGNSTTGKNP